MEQRSDEWFAARIGKVTASRVADLMARTKSGYSASRSNYMAELVCERLTGTPTERFSSAAMQWGTDIEPQARAVYELESGNTVDEIGFVLHRSITDFGASPDGLIGTDGLVEIKCPNTATHIETLRTETIEGKYLTQMQSQMACTGRKWCDFVSFDPRMPPEMQLFFKRIYRDNERISEIETEINSFMLELEKTITDLNKRYRAEKNRED